MSTVEEMVKLGEDTKKFYKELDKLATTMNDTTLSNDERVGAAERLLEITEPVGGDIE